MANLHRNHHYGELSWSIALLSEGWLWFKLSHDATRRSRTNTPTSATSANSSIGDLIAPVNGYRDAQMRRGIKPRDHARENRMAIREAQLRNREKQNEVRGKPSKPRTTDHPNLVDIEPALYQVAVKVEPFKMQQFRNVKSRVKKEMEWLNLWTS